MNFTVFDPFRIDTHVQDIHIRYTDRCTHFTPSSMHGKHKLDDVEKSVEIWMYNVKTTTHVSRVFLYVPSPKIWCYREKLLINTESPSQIFFSFCLQFRNEKCDVSSPKFTKKRLGWNCVEGKSEKIERGLPHKLGKKFSLFGITGKNEKNREGLCT